MFGSEASVSLTEVRAINVYMLGEVYQPGKYTFNWNGKDNNGTMVSSGIYFISFKSKFDTSVKKIVVIR